MRRETGNTMGDAEQKRILDDMLAGRIRGGQTEADAVRQILAIASNVPDDTSLIVEADGTKLDARTIRVWASFYRTPEQKQ